MEVAGVQNHEVYCDKRLGCDGSFAGRLPLIPLEVLQVVCDSGATASVSGRSRGCRSERVEEI